MIKAILAASLMTSCATPINQMDLVICGIACDVRDADLEEICRSQFRGLGCKCYGEPEVIWIK